MTDRWQEWRFDDAIDFQEGPGILAKDFRGSGVPPCEQGGEAIEKMCRKQKDPRKAALCWAARYAGEGACKGWCYARYTD